VKIEVTADIVCSWSYLGVTRLNHVLREFRAAGNTAEVSYLPFQLAPNAPSQPMPLLDAIRFVFGEEGVRQTARVAEIAAREGVRMNFGKGIANNTFEAHRLIHIASAQGLGEPMTERLFRAHFTDGLDVGDRETLKGLASETGVRWTDEGADEVRALLARVRADGVSQVPVFTFEHGGRVSGAVSQEVLASALREAAAFSR
jgi:predicted DsbA family dithiol-disulfide isomerase